MKVEGCIETICICLQDSKRWSFWETRHSIRLLIYISNKTKKCHIQYDEVYNRADLFSKRFPALWKEVVFWFVIFFVFFSFLFVLLQQKVIFICTRKAKVEQQIVSWPPSATCFTAVTLEALSSWTDGWSISHQILDWHHL